MQRKTSISWSVKQLEKSEKKGNISLDHTFQRNLVWNDKRKSLLIDSIWRDYPIPAIYSSREDKTYSVFDGKQRVTTLVTFIRDEFKLVGLDGITLEDGSVFDPNGLTYSELPEELSDSVKDCMIVVYFYDDMSDDEKAEMMFRLNNGKPLTQIEITRIKAKSLDSIRRLARHEFFTNNLTSTAIQRYTNEDIVIKTYILLYNEDPSLETKVVRPFTEIMEFTEEQTAEMEKVYDYLMQVCDLLNVRGTKESKRCLRRIVKPTHILSLIPTVKYCVSDNISVEKFVMWCIEFFSGEKEATISELYNENASKGSLKPSAIRTRLKEVDDSFTEFVVSMMESDGEQESSEDGDGDSDPDEEFYESDEEAHGYNDEQSYEG